LSGRVAIIGAGSWGTALACALAGGAPEGGINLWSRDPQQAEVMRTTRHNPRYLSDVAIPVEVDICDDLSVALTDAGLIILTVPAKAMATTARAVSGVLRTHLRHVPEIPLVLSAAKGLDPGTGQLMSQLLVDIMGDRAVTGALSGPNIAREVAQGLPATTVIACRDGTRALEAQRRISCHRLRAYTNDDVVGVEVGGAMKNVIAIAAGIADGMKAGDNAKAAIMTRGLVEMSRLGAALGARQSTFAGLTGLGDLIVTCVSPLSRNHALGIGIGEGKSVTEMEAELKMVAEGVNTTREALRLGRRLEVDLPIAEAVAAVLFEDADLMQTALSLMARTGRSELEGLNF